MYRFSNWYFR